MRRYKCPRPLEPLAVQPHREAAVALLLEQFVRAAVPDLDRARAVVPFRDLALEAPVLERMVLDVDREVLLTRLERDALRHRPRGKNTVALEAEVVVQSPGVVPLHDEDRAPRLAALAAERLRSFLPLSLALVLRELLPHAAFLLPRARCVHPTEVRKRPRRRSVYRFRAVCLSFTQRTHGGDKPVDGVDSVRLGNARNYANLP